MFRDKIPLPDKIRESGEGYTLSGKPLDPNSAAAKPYLSRNGGASSNKPAKKPQAKVDDPMQGVEHQQKEEEKEVMVQEKTGQKEEQEKMEEEKIEEEKMEEEKMEEEKTESKPTQAMEIDEITKAVETQTKELTIGDDDKKTVISNLKEKKTKSATPSPSNSST